MLTGPDGRAHGLGDRRCQNGPVEQQLISLLKASSTLLADLDQGAGGAERLLVRSDRTGTVQLYELSPGAQLRQLTALADPVGKAVYLPGTRLAALQVDQGGNERFQLYLLDLDRGEVVRDVTELEALTGDPHFGHHLAGVSADGSVLAYTSNRQNGVDFDLWLCVLSSGEHHLLFAGGGWCEPASGFSPDGRWISVNRAGPRPLDAELLLVEVSSGLAREVLRHDSEAAEVGWPAWVGPETFLVSSNVGRDFSGVVRVDLSTGDSGTLAGTGLDSDCQPYSSRDGSALLLVENRNGSSRLTLHDLHRGGEGREVPLAEPGVVIHHTFPPPLLSANGSRIYYTLSTPRLAGDVWCFDAGAGITRRLTESPAPAGTSALVQAEVGEVASFDGERIPLFLFTPRGRGEPLATVVKVHGGPESQAVLAYDPVIQGLVARGYAVVVPNVRGSTGYGKRYASLDDTRKRLDSVRDLAAVHGWLATAGLAPERAALWGGSYGGYMVLAGLAFQPDLWAAGVDVVGISNLVTFLENTSEYRRAHREREYGSLTADRDFLALASPMSRVDDIRAPLFVIHGRNDPRVPVTEAEQLAARLDSRGIPCELRIYEDEGHGLARLSNRLDAYPKAVDFLDRVLGRTDKPQAVQKA